MAGGRQGAPGFSPGRLKALRELAGLTQSALAEAAQVPAGAVAEYESGRRVPQVEKVRALATALGQQPVDLLEVDRDRGLTLQELRAVSGLSQAEAATRAGLPRTTYSMVERGESVSVSPADATAIADVLGVDEPTLRAAHERSRARHLQRRRATDNGAARAGPPTR